MNNYLIKNKKFKLKNKLTLLLAILIVFIIYLPMVKGIPVALIIFSIIGIYGYIKNFKSIIKKKFIVYFSIFTVLLLIGILYSIDFKYGIKTFLYNILSIIMMIAGYTINKNFKNDDFLKFIVLVSIIPSVCNILFVINSKLEWEFLNSNIAKFFIEPSSLKLFMQENKNNVMDINKAGTFFVNTNNASVYFILILCVSIVLYISTKNKRYIITSGLIFIAEICTGCRTGILAMAIIGIYYIVNYNKNIIKVFKKIISISILIFIIFMVYWSINSEQIIQMFNRLSLESVSNDHRGIIWSYAIKELKIFGLGYGGWESISQTMSGYYSGMPLHNHILIILSWSGIFGLFGYLLFWGSIIKNSFISWKFNRKYNALLRSFITINVLVHGLFDNYFLQNLNLLIIIFVLIGYTSYNINIDI